MPEELVGPLTVLIWVAIINLVLTTIMAAVALYRMITD